MFEKLLVFTGRPNSGKSNIIRAIIGLDVAIGKRPGTTRSISKHPLSHGLVLVDMPRFGRMTGVSKRLSNKMSDRIIRFLESNAQSIALVVHVLDISTFSEVTERLEKKGFISVDVEMVSLQFLAKTLGEIPLVAANKIDKANEEEIDDNLEKFMQQISGGDSSSIAGCVFPVSAKVGDGLGALKSAIHERLVVKGYKTPFKTH